MSMLSNTVLGEGPDVTPPIAVDKFLGNGQ